jgi:1L-myo-inositol 1-phosphate cytidylyltransferase / CDP-L-myo-inositol myo-inositolphosphotransferase
VPLELSAGSALPKAGRRILVWCGGSEPSPLVAGVPLWQRAVLTAVRAGFEHILVVAGTDAEGRAAELARDPRTRGRAIEVVAASDGWPSRLDPEGGRRVVLDERWIVDPALLAALAESAEGVVAATPDGPFAADEEDLRRWARDGWRPSRPPLVPIECREPRPALYVRAASPADVAAAEDALFAALSRNDGNLFARFVDRVLSRAISRRLAPTSVTPNQITLASIAVGLAGAASLLHPSYEAGVLGTLLFLVSTILDGCDGEIARVKFRESPFGAKLDLVGDNLVHVFLFPCLAIRFWLAGEGGHFVWLGVVTLAGAAASWLAVWKIVARPDPAWGVVGFFEAFANREFAYLLFVLALVDRLAWFVWAMAIGIWVFPAGLLALHVADRVRRDARPRSSAN